jgi:hypothetical protein
VLFYVQEGNPKSIICRTAIIVTVSHNNLDLGQVNMPLIEVVTEISEADKENSPLREFKLKIHLYNHSC